MGRQNDGFCINDQWVGSDGRVDEGRAARAGNTATAAAHAFINLNMEVSSNVVAVYFYCTPRAVRPNATPNLFPCILISPSEQLLPFSRGFIANSICLLHSSLCLVGLRSNSMDNIGRWNLVRLRGASTVISTRVRDDSRSYRGDNKPLP